MNRSKDRKETGFRGCVVVVGCSSKSFQAVSFQAIARWRTFLMAILIALIQFHHTQIASSQQVVPTPARWPSEQQLGPFKLHANFDLASLPGLPAELDQLRRDVSTTLNLNPPQEPIYIFLFDRKSAYQNYLRNYFPNVPNRKAIYVKQRGPGMVFAYFSDDFSVDLRHETTHALLHANLAVVPLWLDEGIAEYFEVAPADRATGHSSWSSLKWKARLGRLRQLEKLEAITDVKKMSKGDYDEAFGWVHFMFNTRAVHWELNSFLADIDNANQPGILSHRLRVKLGDLSENHKKHVSTWSVEQATQLATPSIR